MINEILLEYGFSEIQSRIYVACLEFGNAPASSIARKIGENRITVYSALKDMCKKGMAFELIKHTVKYYSVMSPKEIVLQQKVKYDKINSMLPEFMSLAMNGNVSKPSVYYYEGFEGLKEIYEDHLKSEHGKFSFFGANEAPKVLQDYWINYLIPKRAEVGVFAKVIVSRDGYNKFYASKDKNGYKETLIIHNSSFKLTGDISLYSGNKISMCMYPSETNMYGVVLESKDLYDSLFNIFNLIWSTYEKIEKPH